MQLLGNKFKLRKDYPSAPVSEDTITRGKQFDSLVQKHGPVVEQVAHYLITRDKLFDTVLYYIKHEQPLPLDWQRRPDNFDQVCHWLLFPDGSSMRLHCNTEQRSALYPHSRYDYGLWL